MRPLLIVSQVMGDMRPTSEAIEAEVLLLPKAADCELLITLTKPS